MAEDIEHPAYASVAGEPGEWTAGYPTQMRLHEGEDWKVPTDHGSATFSDYVKDTRNQYTPRELELMGEAWRASLQRHCATLRRTGWLDQKGRVWIRTPAAAEFDGGSLTPLLIDVRED